MKSKPAETSTVILAWTQTDNQHAGAITDGVVSRMAVSRTSPRRWPAATRNNPDFLIGNRAGMHFRRFRQARDEVLRCGTGLQDCTREPRDRWRPAYAIGPLG